MPGSPTDLVLTTLSPVDEQIRTKRNKTKRTFLGAPCAGNDAVANLKFPLTSLRSMTFVPVLRRLATVQSLSIFLSLSDSRKRKTSAKTPFYLSKPECKAKQGKFDVRMIAACIRSDMKSLANSPTRNSALVAWQEHIARFLPPVF